MPDYMHHHTKSHGLPALPHHPIPHHGAALPPAPLLHTPGYVMHYLPYDNYVPVHAETLANPPPVPHHPGAAHQLVPGTHILPETNFLPLPAPHPEVRSLRGARVRRSPQPQGQSFASAFLNPIDPDIKIPSTSSFSSLADLDYYDTDPSPLVSTSSKLSHNPQIHLPINNDLLSNIDKFIDPKYPLDKSFSSSSSETKQQFNPPQNLVPTLRSYPRTVGTPTPNRQTTTPSPRSSMLPSWVFPSDNKRDLSQVSATPYPKSTYFDPTPPPLTNLASDPLTNPLASLPTSLTSWDRQGSELLSLLNSVNINNIPTQLTMLSKPELKIKLWMTELQDLLKCENNHEFVSPAGGKWKIKS